MKEKLTAAYIFVWFWRCVAWLMLTLGTIGCIVLLGLQMVSGLISLTSQLTYNSKQMKRLEEEHARIVSEEAVQAKEALPAYNESFQQASAQIAKVNPSADFKRRMPLVLPVPSLTFGDREEKEVEAKLKQAQENLVTDKGLLYGDIETNLQAMLTPLQEKVNDHEKKREELQNNVRDLQTQIENIRYPMTKQEVEYTRKVMLPVESVYEKDDENSVDYETMHLLGLKLPLLAGVTNGNSPVRSEIAQKWRESLCRLGAWLPMVVNLKEIRKEGKRNMNHVLTTDERARIQTLKGQISDLLKQIDRINGELVGSQNRLREMASIGQQVLQSKELVLKDWKYENDFGKLRRIYEKAIDERKKYEGEKAELIAARKGIYRRWGYEGFGEILARAACLFDVWLTWALLLVITDFLVCPVVCALRSQGLELSAAFRREKDGQ